RPAAVAQAVRAAAADDVVGARRRPERVARRAARVIALAEPVGAPLPDVAVHVVEAQRVRLVAAHLAGAREGGVSVRALLAGVVAIGGGVSFRALLTGGVAIGAVEVRLRGAEPGRGGGAHGGLGGDAAPSAGILPLRLAGQAILPAVAPGRGGVELLEEGLRVAEQHLLDGVVVGGQPLDGRGAVAVAAERGGVGAHQ